MREFFTEHPGQGRAGEAEGGHVEIGGGRRGQREAEGGRAGGGEAGAGL